MTAKKLPTVDEFLKEARKRGDPLGISSDPELMEVVEKMKYKRSEPEKPQMYKHTFEVKLIVESHSSSPDLDYPRDHTGARLPYESMTLAGVPTVRKIKISPNRIAYTCPTKGCNLRWIHKIGKDDPELTPKYCAYCIRKSRAAIVKLQKEGDALREKFKTVTPDLAGAMLMRKQIGSLKLRYLAQAFEKGEVDEAEIERVKTLVDEGTDFRTRVEAANCDFKFEDDGTLGEGYVRIVAKEVPLVKDKPFTV